MRKRECGRAGRRARGAFVVLAVWAAGASATEATAGGRATTDVRVAVAANFAGLFDAIARSFETADGFHVIVSTGSTGALYSQISNGAPFDVFMAADTLRPALLEQSGATVAGTRFTYAVGRLVLWSADSLRLGGDGEVALRAADVRKIAVANPKTAPYGRAAKQVLLRLDLWDTLEPRLVFGENVGQTFGFVESGAAQLGFIARSQALDPRLHGRGSMWMVPDSLYDPIRQDAVLLVHGGANDGAKALLGFLRRPEVLALLERFGYGLP
jgi:molybdate transport system substrate-binding protein